MYPFGLQHKGYNNVTSSNGNSVAQKLKYNGKELQDELGLDLYDYGARNYDPALGRWFGIDPLSEDYLSSSPYGFVGNNPITNLEIDGRFWIRTVGKDGTVTYTAEEGDSAYSLFQQFGEQDGLTAEMANELVVGTLGPNYVRDSDGMLMSDVEVGDTINVYTEETTETTETTNSEDTVREEVKPLVDPKAYRKWHEDFSGMANAQLNALAIYRSHDNKEEAMSAYLWEQVRINHVEIGSSRSTGGSGSRIGGVRGSRRGANSTSNRRSSTNTRVKKPQTVTVSGQTKTVQTGARGGKYYINKNGNKTYLNRDGSKRK